MLEAGQKAFAARDARKAAVYSYEREHARLAPAHEKALRANAKAWAFFSAQGDYFKRLAAHWVSSAKQEETRVRRLTELIACAEQGTKPGAFPK